MYYPTLLAYVLLCLVLVVFEFLCRLDLIVLYFTFSVIGICLFTKIFFKVSETYAELRKNAAPTKVNLSDFSMLIQAD